MVFTHGSGAAIRQSFFGLGFLLASKGIAVLKYDKRGSGESTGNLRGSSFVDLADDAVAGARLLTGHSEIDPKRVGFWGLSQGSSIAPLAASRFPGTGFVMAASGGGLSIDQWELLEGEDQLRTDGHFSEADIVEALAFERTRDHYLKTKESWEEYAAARKNAEGKAWYDYPTTDFFGPTDRDDSYWTDTAKFYFYDGVPALSTLRCPFLGIFGAWDTPSSDERNVGAYRAALTAAGNKDVTLRILPGGNHDLFETASGNARELPQAKRFVPEFFPLILGWLKEHGFFTPR